MSSPIRVGKTLDINRAREDAKQQAMRELVEQVLGVKIQGSTEVINSMFVNDKILSNSLGQATINKIIKEKMRADIFYIEMDVMASADRIRSTAKNLKSRLDAKCKSVRNALGGLYEVMVKASFELVGFYTSDIDVFDKYFKAVSLVRNEAIIQASACW